MGGGGGIVFSSFAFGDSVRLRRGRPLVVVELVVVSETLESVFDMTESTVVSGDSGRGLFAGRADELFDTDDDEVSTLVEKIFSDSFFFIIFISFNLIN